MVVAGLAGLMGYTAWASVRNASVPNGYVGARWEHLHSGPWVFPREEVQCWLTVMVVEGVLIAWGLAARGEITLARRSLISAVLMLIVFLFMSPLLMHVTSPLAEHLGWLFFGSAWLASCALVTFVVARAVAVGRHLRHRRRREPREPPVDVRDN
jgi:hypothetical protein